MYNFGIVLYGLTIRFASLFNKKARKMIKGQHATWGILKSKVNKEDRYIWVHAASLGEFEQGRPLIEKIKAEHPEYKILLTFFSPSGYEVRKEYSKADIICYLPFDTLLNVLRFFLLVRPEKALFIKYEFWPNYFMYMKMLGIQLYSVSSIFRPGQIFFKKHGLIARRMLMQVTHFFVQDQRSKELLAGLGLTDNVTIVGDTRFDRVKAIMQQSKSLPLVESFIQRRDSEKENVFTLVAGSSWPKDEDLLIEYFNNHPEMRLIIAPHEIHEEHLSLIVSKITRPFVRYTQSNEEDIAHADCLIVDCFGVLSSIYRYGQVAYIGGGFGAGIHNIIEAAVYGVPVIFGPNHDKFREAKELMAMGGGHSIGNYEELSGLLDRYIREEGVIKKDGNASSDYVKANLGATETIISALNL